MGDSGRNEPKKILIVSERESCKGSIAKAALEKIIDESWLEISVDSAAYRNPEQPEDRAGGGYTGEIWYFS